MTQRGKILFIDDEIDFSESLIEVLRPFLPESKWECCVSQLEVTQALSNFKPDLCLLDLVLDTRLSVESGFQVLAEIMRFAPDQRVIVLTGHENSELGVRALNQGAANFLRKPPNVEHLAALIKDGIAQSRVRKELVELRAKQLFDLSQFLVGESPQMRKVRELVFFAGTTSQPVLLTGETGTGKGECAIAIHKFGRRRLHNFVRYQPAVASQDLITSELFGHSKGAYTGALVAKKGLIEEASEGTLFLDEVDEFGLGTQVALLGVLQNKSIRPVGENRDIAVDFRLICATNTDTQEALRSGKLREDFYHRIAHLTIYLPPLRDRQGDITLLARHVLTDLNLRGEIGRLFLSDNAILCLEHYSWPGNIRELIAVVENAAFRAIFEGRSFIGTSDISFVLPRDRNLALDANAQYELVRGDNFKEKVEAYKLILIQDALKESKGNQSKAAELLGLDRSSFRRILQRKDISN